MQIKDIVFVYQLKTPKLVEWHSRRHHHDSGEYELHYFLNGEGRFEKGRERYVISPGTLHFSPPLEHHAIRPGTIRRPVSYYAVLFTVEPANPLSSVLDDASYTASFPRPVGARYRVLFEDLKNRYTHTRPARRHAAVHMLQSLLWDLAADAELSVSAGGNDDFNIHIARAIGIFEHNIRSRVTVAEVSRRLGITQAHLTRLFTEHFGVSPLQYYRRLRMDVAASLLLNTTRSVKEISWELGYSNPFHFSRSFSRYADMSPRAYREQYFRHNPTKYAGRIVGT
ncbi:MAG: helix-turn-helix domain-containing protein [Alkalispirochaeta sp.]